MIELMPKWVLENSTPSFYDKDSVTVIQATAKLYAKMNELITDYTKFAGDLKALNDAFISTTTNDQEVFKTSIRQEFQDFIDAVDLKLEGYEHTLDDFRESVEEVVLQVWNEAFASGKVTIEPVYNEASESLEFRIVGKVV